MSDDLNCDLGDCDCDCNFDCCDAFTCSFDAGCCCCLDCADLCTGPVSQVDTDSTNMIICCCLPGPANTSNTNARYRPWRMQQVPLTKYPAQGTYLPTKIQDAPPRNYHMDGIYPPANKMPEFPPTNYATKGAYPPAKTDEAPLKLIPPIHEEMDRAKQREELHMPPRDSRLQGVWSKHTVYDHRARQDW